MIFTDPKDTKSPSSGPPTYAKSTPVQRFYSPALRRESNIRTRFDGSAGVFMVLWSQIQKSFPNVATVRDYEGVEVDFLVDENFEELHPLRIEYHPQVVLTVVLQTELGIPSDTQEDALTVDMPPPFEDRAPKIATTAVALDASAQAASPNQLDTESFENDATLATSFFLAPALTPDDCTTSTTESKATTSQPSNSFLFRGAATSENDFYPYTWSTPTGQAVIEPRSRTEDEGVVVIPPGSAKTSDEFSPLNPSMDGIGQVPQQAYHAASNSSSADSSEPYAHIDQDLLSADIIDPEPICGLLLSLHAASYLKQSELGKVLDRISMNISQGYYSLFALYVDALLAGERAHAKNFKQLMAGLISTMANAESTANHGLTLREMRGVRDVRDVREEEEASVDKLLLMHQDVLNSLADLQCRVRILVNTTYELFRYTPPRLFIVLPATEAPLDRSKSAKNKFRVYFLCEHIGPSSAPSSSSMSCSASPHIHLASHIGYDLLQPNNFFNLFGVHVLTVMEMVRYGITTTSLEIPEFDSFKLLNGIDDINDHSLSKSTLAAMLDDAINYIRNWLARKSATDIRPDHTALDPLILSCLPSFLIGKSSDSLGNLHRTLSTDGHIKWVCQDHYRAQFTSDPAEALDKFISKHLQGPTHDDIGLVSKKSGYVMISSTSREVAKEFYKHLGVVREVYNLRFRFAWQATKSDIQLFCDAVQRSNVRLLIVDSSTFATSGRTLRDTSRLRPVMSLMESGKLQNISLGLEFVDNVMGLGGTSIPNLRVLMLELGSFSKSIRVNFSRFLSRFTHLVELLLRCNDIEKVYTLIQERIHSIPALERLKLDTQDKYVDIRLQAGTIELSGRFHAAQRIIDDRDITMIRIPFDTNTFASDVSWLDQRYTGRHRALVVEFFGMNNEAIAGVEFRPLGSTAGTNPYGERFRGDNSTMFIRWGDHDSLLPSECIQDSSGMRLDFSALNQDWIQSMLRSFASKHHQGLEIVCSPLPDDQRRLITSGIDTATWNSLTYLVLGGADLDDWATDLARVLNRASLQHLQRLTIAGNKKCLSAEFAGWIASMLSSASPLEGLCVISLKDVHLSSRSWFSVISTMDCSSLRTLNLRGSTIQPSHLECLIQEWPLGAPLESLLLHDIGWIGALSRAGRERIRSQLVIKAKQAEVKYY